MSIIIKKRGFTLVETLIYSIGVILLVGTIITMLSNMYRWYDQMTIGPRADQAGITLIDAIGRSIQSGQSINTGSSLFDVTLGNITINSKVNGATISKYYGIQNSRIVYSENGGATSFISPDDLSVTKFTLKQVTTPISTAIRIELDIAYELRGITTTRTYSGVSIMRNSY